MDDALTESPVAAPVSVLPAKPATAAPIGDALVTSQLPVERKVPGRIAPVAWTTAGAKSRGRAVTMVKELTQETAHPIRLALAKKLALDLMENHPETVTGFEVHIEIRENAADDIAVRVIPKDV